MFNRGQPVEFKTSRSVGYINARFVDIEKRKSGTWYVLEKRTLEGERYLIAIRPSCVKARTED